MPEKRDGDGNVGSVPVTGGRIVKSSLEEKKHCSLVVHGTGKTAVGAGRKVGQGPMGMAQSTRDEWPIHVVGVIVNQEVSALIQGTYVPNAVKFIQAALLEKKRSAAIMCQHLTHYTSAHAWSEKKGAGLEPTVAVEEASPRVCISSDSPASLSLSLMSVPPSAVDPESLL